MPFLGPEFLSGPIIIIKTITSRAAKMCGVPPEDSSKSSIFLEKRKAYPHSADVNLELGDCKEPCSQQVAKSELSQHRQTTG